MQIHVANLDLDSALVVHCEAIKRYEGRLSRSYKPTAKCRFLAPEMYRPVCLLAPEGTGD